MRFTKMHALGNDYVYVDCFRDKAPADPAALSVRVSKFHTGIGSDGLILILPEEGYDARMRIFNADGSEAEMCGNGLRCVARYLKEAGYLKGDEARVITGGGPRFCTVLTNGMVRADMGAAELSGSCVLQLPHAGRTKFFKVSMGNPHAVTFDVYEEGPAFTEDGRFVETNPEFPNGVNAEFVRVNSRSDMDVRVWERGSGATLACGTGACACAAAANARGLCGKESTVRLPGGELLIELRDHVYLTGEAVISFTGDWYEN